MSYLTLLFISFIIDAIHNYKGDFMLRQQAFENAKTMLKGGLHCHTTRSDGDGTPEEVIRLHKEHNYDFLALTDHVTYNYKNFAPETNITIIPGMEFDNKFVSEDGFRTFHVLALGPDDETNGYVHDEEPDSTHEPNQEAFQKHLDEIHNKNNITIYCHPEWSSTPARYFEKQKGHVAMEIWNSGCAIEDEMDMNASYWDEILGQGIKWYGVATDDGHKMSHHCKGWVMVNAENNVKDILKAICDGKFYSSCGPVIKDFYVDDNGVAHIETSPCKKIFFHADRHPNKKIEATDALLTSAEYNLSDKYKYIRASVVDENGNRAWTNPIFIKD